MNVLLFLVGLFIGWYLDRILWEISRIRSALRPKQKAGVATPRVGQPIRSSTTVVSPKTPSRVQYEIDLEMKRQAGIIE
jgi:F420-0:gamma-glutamyl ligase-like protein